MLSFKEKKIKKYLHKKTKRSALVQHEDEVISHMHANPDAVIIQDEICRVRQEPK